MKRHFWLLTLLLLPGISRGQEKVEDDFERYAREQEAAFSEYVGHEEKNFKAYYDSINREFAQYLAEAWPDYPLKKRNHPSRSLSRLLFTSRILLGLFQPDNRSSIQKNLSLPVFLLSIKEKILPIAPCPRFRWPYLTIV